MLTSKKSVPHQQKAIARWLFFTAFMVFIMVIVGGLTRLTESGLSITEWKPVTGVVPPMTGEDWEEAFALYKATPEYQQINKGMSMESFQFIYWLEFIHRMLGRLIGVIFFVPFVFYMARGYIDRPLFFRLSGILLLGGLQGFFGWYMVKSGLVDVPEVSQYRLTLHLVTAFIIYAALLLQGLSLWYRGKGYVPIQEPVLRPLYHFSILITGLIFLQVASGGLVAGLKAGLTYNSWPLMDGKIIPDNLMMMTPWFINFTENITMVQFQHRMIAYLLTALILWFWWMLGQYPLEKRLVIWRHHLLGMLIVQVTLGIKTLLLVVPTGLAVAHQGGAMLLLTFSLFLNFLLYGKTSKQDVN